MKTACRLVSAIVLMGAAVFATGCGGSGTAGEPDRFAALSDDELLAKGRMGLSTNTYAAADEYLGELLRRRPDDPRALYGLVLSDMLHWVGIIDMVIGLLSDDTLPNRFIPRPDGTGERLAARFEPEPDPLGFLIGTIFRDLREVNRRQIERIEKLRKISDPVFTLDAFPVEMKRARLFQLGTEWDAADLRMISALTRGLSALLDLLDSQGLDTAGLTMIYPDLIDGLSLASLPGLIVALLERYPTFLALPADGRGADRITSAKASLTLMAADILEARALIEAETDNQADDVLIVGPKVRGVDQLLLQGVFPDADGATKDRISLLWQGERYGLKQTADRLAANLAGTPDSRVRLEHDVIAPVGMLADLIRQTTTLGGLLGMVGIDLDPELIGLVDDLSARTPEEMPKAIVSFLKLLLFDPAAVELDLNAALSRPAGLRDIVPNWETGLPFGEAGFLAEYECARLGWRDGSLVDAVQSGRGTLAIVLDDPFDPVASPVVTVRVDGGTDRIEPVDEEQFVLSPVFGRPGRFTVDIPYRVRGNQEPDPATPGDGTVEFLGAGGEEVIASYREQAIPGEPMPAEIAAAYDADDGTTDRIWSPSLDCQEDTARDLPHFTTPSADLFTLPNAGPAVLQSIWTPLEADRWPANGPNLAWRSGSLNNLLWIDLDLFASGAWGPGGSGLPNRMSKANPVSLNLFMQFMLEKLGSL